MKTTSVAKLIRWISIAPSGTITDCESGRILPIHLKMAACEEAELTIEVDIQRECFPERRGRTFDDGEPRFPTRIACRAP